jgi:hypothetical protein
MEGYSFNRNPDHPKGLAVGAICGFQGSSCNWSGGIGTVTAAFFPALLGGVPVTSGQRPQEIGRQESAPTIMPFHWYVGEAVLLHGGRLGAWQIELDEDVVQVIIHEYDSTEWDDSTRGWVPCRRVMYPLRPRQPEPEPPDPELAEEEGKSTCDVCGSLCYNDQLHWGDEEALGEYLKVCHPCYKRITNPHGPVPAPQAEREN